MSSVLTQLSMYRVDNKTTTPVILKGEQGRDYITIRAKTADTACYIGALVSVTIDKTMIVGAANAAVNGIIPDTIFNRAQFEKDKNASWDYTTTLSLGVELDVVLPLNPIAVRANVAATCGGIDLNVPVASAANGQITKHVTAGIGIGRALCKVTNGTGAQVGAMLFSGANTASII